MIYSITELIYVGSIWEINFHYPFNFSSPTQLITMNVTQYGPYCILCRSTCAPDMNYCLPQCKGRQSGNCHFFCQRCWEQTLSRVACDLAACTGCAIGHPAFPMSVPTVEVEHRVEGDVDMM